jgi:EAL domain-containing protein (putative c-di-GMP-specific phosphodiesterase class I)
VESEAQLELLRNYDCDEYQGFLFSRPVPADEFALLVQNRSSGDNTKQMP